MKMRSGWVVLAAALVGLGLAEACSSSSETAGNPGGTAAGGNAASGGSSASGANGGAGGWANGGPADCQGHTYQCGDGLDNDNDGLIDSQDPDCLGPCDNTEDSYFGGIPGQNSAPCKMDCYFDQDTGSGNDDCYWNHQCDPHEVAPDYYPEPGVGSQCEYDTGAKTPGTNASCSELEQTQSQACLDYCGPLTPNGCDCFGCCELPAGSGKFVWLGSTGANENTVCSIADLDDPTICHPCLPVSACLNGCEPCELCLGKTELPPECGGGGGGGGPPTQECPTGYPPCGQAGQAPCAAGTYCITGCCVPTPK